ncbi:TPA_exp: putative MFS transporter [Trichophyton benhamiae CBS 112371]|nr:TPA_exp: putative MFS transporter [Trichophyton benhamiae CBS 112371]
MADVVRLTPKTQLFETIICNGYYHGNGHDSMIPLGITTNPCKGCEVQSRLATIKARLKVIENIFALMLAIPFGNLANKRGRVFVLALGTIGQMLSEIWVLIVSLAGGSIPYESIYISSILKSAGGGGIVIAAVAHTILSDVVPADRRAQAFLYLASALLITEMVAPVLASLLMQNWNVYAPLVLGLVFELFGSAVLFMIPETAKRVQDGGDLSIDDGSFESRSEERERYSFWSGVKTTTKHIIAPFALVWKMIRADRNIPFVATSFLVLSLGRNTLEFLIQYTSKRFGWTLAEANYLISFRAAINLILFLIILPALTRFLTSRGMQSAQMDLWIARVSSIFSIVALLLFTFSFGFHPAIKSYATSLVLPNDVATLYASFAVISIIGELAASPLIAATFTLGLSIGGAALGLPFFVTAVLFLVCGIGSFCAQMPNLDDEL